MLLGVVMTRSGRSGAGTEQPENQRVAQKMLGQLSDGYEHFEFLIWAGLAAYTKNKASLISRMRTAQIDNR